MVYTGNSKESRHRSIQDLRENTNKPKPYPTAAKRHKSVGVVLLYYTQCPQKRQIPGTKFAVFIPEKNLQPGVRMIKSLFISPKGRETKRFTWLLIISVLGCGCGCGEQEEQFLEQTQPLPTTPPLTLYVPLLQAHCPAVPITSNVLLVPFTCAPNEEVLMGAKVINPTGSDSEASQKLGDCHELIDSHQPLGQALIYCTVESPFKSILSTRLRSSNLEVGMPLVIMHQNLRKNPQSLEENLGGAKNLIQMGNLDYARRINRFSLITQDNRIPLGTRVDTTTAKTIGVRGHGFAPDDEGIGLNPILIPLASLMPWFETIPGLLGEESLPSPKASAQLNSSFR